MRKFAYKEQTDRQTDKHRIQTLRPLYPLWILEGVGQLENLMTKNKEQRTNRQTDTRFNNWVHSNPLWILSGYSRELANNCTVLHSSVLYCIKREGWKREKWENLLTSSTTITIFWYLDNRNYVKMGWKYFFLPKIPYWPTPSSIHRG